MNSKKSSKIVLMIVIVDRRKKDELLTALNDYSSRITCVMYGRGSVGDSSLRHVLGLDFEDNKAVIACVLPSSRRDAVFDMLERKFSLNEPGKGVAFTMRVDNLCF